MKTESPLTIHNVVVRIEGKADYKAVTELLGNLHGIKYSEDYTGILFYRIKDGVLEGYAITMNDKNVVSSTEFMMLAVQDSNRENGAQNDEVKNDHADIDAYACKPTSIDEVTRVVTEAYRLGVDIGTPTVGDFVKWFMGKPEPEYIAILKNQLNAWDGKDVQLTVVSVDEYIHLMRCAIMDKPKAEEQKADSKEEIIDLGQRINELIAGRNKGRMLMIDVSNMHEAELMERIEALHAVPLNIERYACDVLNRNEVVSILKAMDESGYELEKHFSLIGYASVLIRGGVNNLGISEGVLKALDCKDGDRKTVSVDLFIKMIKSLAKPEGQDSQMEKSPSEQDTARSNRTQTLNDLMSEAIKEQIEKQREVCEDELTALNIVESMCAESLSPKHYKAWRRVQSALLDTRKPLRAFLNLNN